MRLWFGLAVLIAGLGATMAADTIPATGGNITLTPMTHAHVQIEFGGKVIHVDPTNQSNLAASKPADIILVTDIHGDHMDPAAIDQIEKAYDDLRRAQRARRQVPRQDGDSQERRDADDRRRQRPWRSAPTT